MFEQFTVNMFFPKDFYYMNSIYETAYISAPVVLISTIV